MADRDIYGTDIINLYDNNRAMENTITMFFTDTAITRERNSGSLVLTGPGPKGIRGNLNISGYPDIKSVEQF